MSVVFVMYVALSIDSSSPLWAGGRERTLVIRFGRDASYGSSGNHGLSLTGAVLDPWAERCTYFADGFLLSSSGHTLTIRLAKGRWITGIQAQMMPRFGSIMLHSMITTVLSEMISTSEMEGTRGNLHVTSGLMDAFRNVARKQLTTRTLGQVRLR